MEGSLVSSKCGWARCVGGLPVGVRPRQSAFPSGFFRGPAPTNFP